MKRTKLTDKERTEIIKAYVECQNYSAVGRAFGRSDATVRRAVTKEVELTKKVEQKKEENTESICKHMEAQTARVCDLLDTLLEYIGTKEKLEKSSAKDLATTLGIIIDKYASVKPERTENNGGIVILPEIKQEEQEYGKENRDGESGGRDA